MTGLVGMLNILILGNGIIFDQVQSRELSDLQPNGKQSVFQVSFRDFFCCWATYSHVQSTSQRLNMPENIYCCFKNNYNKVYKRTNISTMHLILALNM